MNSNTKFLSIIELDNRKNEIYQKMEIDTYQEILKRQAAKESEIMKKDFEKKHKENKKNNKKGGKKDK
jgi:hypothetical protein|tara:strand:- start:1053 stop:1256 length:204 start_codon:yes stop_codon:yes gene_type:complete